MNKVFAYHAMMRVLSILALLALLIIRFASARSGRSCPVFFMDILFESLVLSHVVLGMYPDEMQNAGFSLSYSMLTVVMSCLAGLIGKSLLVAFSLLLLYILIIAIGPHSKLKVSFRNDSIWAIFENYVSYVYLFMFLLLSCLYFLASAVPARIVINALLLLLFLLRYASAYTGWTFLVTKSRECQLRRNINGIVHGLPDGDLPEGIKLNAVYERAVKYMEENLPFLDPDYEMEDLAESIFSNKTYVSRSINYYAGKNFRQFLNYYRVMYSVELMKKDPGLTVVELAIQSGFHSTVSYNLSFKVVMNDTPMNYCKEFVVQPKSLSRQKARAIQGR